VAFTVSKNCVVVFEFTASIIMWHTIHTHRGTTENTSPVHYSCELCRSTNSKKMEKRTTRTHTLTHMSFIIVLLHVYRFKPEKGRGVQLEIHNAELGSNKFYKIQNKYLYNIKYYVQGWANHGLCLARILRGHLSSPYCNNCKQLLLTASYIVNSVNSRFNTLKKPVYWHFVTGSN